jgi:hypothetical protein
VADRAIREPSLRKRLSAEIPWGSTGRAAVGDRTALQPLSMYLAPIGVTDSTDRRAELFGRTQAIPAGTDPSARVQLVSNAPAIF